MPANAPAPPLPSATVMLLRDGSAGLEVFMVVRHHQIDFASGALVFPGGKVDASDRVAAMRGCARGSAALDDLALAFRVAAIREAFEECGVLLARPRGSDALIGAEELARLEPWRDELEKGQSGMAELAARHDLELAADLLVPFAHWITPVDLPKRFDTHFYVVPAPIDQLARHSGGESVDSLWINPGSALAEADAGRMTLVFATRMNLAKLARSATVEQALAATRAAPVVTVMPEVLHGPEGPMFRIPAAAGYGVTEVPAKGIPRP